MISLTSSPSRIILPFTKSIVVSSNTLLIDIKSSGLIPSRLSFSPTARYIAPVSIYSRPSLSPTSLAIVLLPAPPGPSMAILIIFTP